MDSMNDIRAWYTVILFAVFIGIVIWAWSSKSQRRFQEAANLPFQETDTPPGNKNSDKNKGDHHE